MVSLAAGKVQARREAANTLFDRLSHQMEARGEKLRAALANAQFNEKVSAASRANVGTNPRPCEQPT